MNEEQKEEEERRKKRRPYWMYILIAAALVTAISSVTQAGFNRPLRYYTNDNGTALTYYTQLGNNTNLSGWGINNDDPNCEFNVGANICINQTGYYFKNSNVSGGGGSGTVTNITAGDGLTSTPNPIVASGTVSVLAQTCSGSSNFTYWNGSTWLCGAPVAGANNYTSFCGVVAQDNYTQNVSCTRNGGTTFQWTQNNSIGPTGPQGPSGGSGPTGPQGPAGNNGTNGYNGNNSQANMSNTDGYLNVSNVTMIINANLSAFDLRYTLWLFSTDLYTNLTLKAGTGDCPSGYHTQNVTTSGPQCYPDQTYTAGPGAVIINNEIDVNATTCAQNGNYTYWNGSAWLCKDGNALWLGIAATAANSLQLNGQASSYYLNTSGGYATTGYVQLWTAGNGNYSLERAQVYGNITALQGSNASIYAELKSINGTINNTASLTITQIMANIGNWSGNASNYATLLYVQAQGNYSAERGGIYANYTAKAGTGDCPTDQFVQNTTTGAPQCYTPAGGGLSITQIMANLGNWSGNQSLYSTIALMQAWVAGNGNYSAERAAAIKNMTDQQAIANYSLDRVTIMGNLSAENASKPTITQIMANIGNWSGNQSLYSTITLMQNWVTGNGNYSLERAPIYSNITALQGSNTTIGLAIGNLTNTTQRSATGCQFFGSGNKICWNTTHMEICGSAAVGGLC